MFKTSILSSTLLLTKISLLTKLEGLLSVASGIVTMLINSFGLILLARLFLGFSVGLVQPIGASLLADYYTD